MARIAIIGPGAIGGTVAAWLAQDHGVQLVPVSAAIKLKTEHAAVLAAE